MFGVTYDKVKWPKGEFNNQSWWGFTFSCLLPLMMLTSFFLFKLSTHSQVHRSNTHLIRTTANSGTGGDTVPGLKPVTVCGWVLGCVASFLCVWSHHREVLPSLCFCVLVVVKLIRKMEVLNWNCSSSFKPLQRFAFIILLLLDSPIYGGRFVTQMDILPHKYAYLSY